MHGCLYRPPGAEQSAKDTSSYTEKSTRMKEERSNSFAAVDTKRKNEGEQSEKRTEDVDRYQIIFSHIQWV